MNRTDKKYKRIMLLISTVMMIVLLCSCRTRITNNTEVGNVITDDSGMMTETYQVRRDELGIPVAEAPLFGTSESGEEYEDEDYSEYDSEYEDEEYDDEAYDEEEEEDDGDSNSDSGTTTGTPANRVVRPRPAVPRPSTPTPAVTTVTVKLDLNAKDAKCSRTSLTVRKGMTYGALPAPERTDYDFEGWYTSKSGGSKVTSSTKVTTDKNHSLYAHWKKQVKKKYTITFDGNGEDDEVTLSSSEKSVQEGGTYGKLPSAKRQKYTFKGWFTDPSKGSQITKTTKFTANKNQTLYAHWEYDAYKWWKNEYDKSANTIDSESQSLYLLDDETAGDPDKADSFLKNCRLSKTDDESEAAYIIKFIKDYSEETAAEEAEALVRKHSNEEEGTVTDARIVIVSREALYGEKEEKLLYMMTMLQNIYGGDYDLEEAEYDLNDGNSISVYTF